MLARRPSDLTPVGQAAMVMGVFDGVHRGHAHLFDATLRAARRLGVASVALVFDPHPEDVLRPGHRVPRLTPLASVLELIRGHGIDHALALQFDDALRNLEPVDFLDALRPAIELRALLMTPESAFGRKRAGTLDLMRTVGVERGFEAIAVEPMLDAGEPISSSRIRSAVEAGDLPEAARMLGRPHRLVGTLDAGQLTVGYAPCLPPVGVYACRWRSEQAVASVDADGIALRVRAGEPDISSGALELLERLDATTLDDGEVQLRRPAG
jgi:riboflavin kinase/FMN adenylyltransferase